MVDFEQLLQMTGTMDVDMEDFRAILMSATELPSEDPLIMVYDRLWEDYRKLAKGLREFAVNNSMHRRL